MRSATLTDLQGNKVGSIIENDDGTLQGEGVGERLLQQAPLKTFDDWKSHLHHSSYLRFMQDEG